MTLDEARALAGGDLRRADFAAEAAYAQATGARERLLQALGEAVQPDPPMRIVAEALRLAEAYRGLIAARRREPVEMTPDEATEMLSWCRPVRSSAVPQAAIAPQAAAAPEDLVQEDPLVATMDLLWELGYAMALLVRRIARGLGGGG